MASPGRPPACTLRYRDASGLFATEATVTAVTITLGAGTLHDADKGAFPLEGLELAARLVNGRVEPVAVRNPGVLTELQQEGLIDAVSSALYAVDRPVSPTTKE